ncbi:MAG: hypothetical protein KatS3mg111_1531 [Pirellulaceae bacterium]|nr:MAG: hypothetical protein KatS3mg111_1531 [Pirellulaceae bacterium]
MLILLLAWNRLWAQSAAPVARTDVPTVTAEEVGFDGQRLAQIAPLVEQAIAAGNMPGCVICVGRHGKIAYLNAFGLRKVAPDAEPMTIDTLFDLASLTKPVATATSIMRLVEEGRLRLDDRVAKYLPTFGSHGKDAIRVVDLLVHQSGLTPDNPLADYRQGPEKAWEKICDLRLIAPVGQQFKYSDVNFIVLGKLVEAISGWPLDQFAAKKIFQPLGMLETGFNPPPELQARAAPTEKRDGQWMRGVVHDPRAYLLGGVAGHAGLFSTASDLARYATAMLAGARLAGGEGGQTVLHPRTVELMTRGYRVSSGWRGLGWDKQTGYSSNRGDLLSPAAFGHGGFTGTVMWIDPELDLFFIFLSNRVHPDGKGSVNHLAGQIANRIATAIRDDTAPAYPHPTSCGIDVLEEDGFRVLRGQRIGLITNHTGRLRDGRTTIEVLAAAPEVDLRVLFSPEHGLEGKLDVARINDSRDRRTGLKVFSLYGDTRRPTPAMMAEIDTLVFDIQDIGTRFYTYVSTMGEAMMAAAEHGKKFVVLDRPNPLDGVHVAGPMLDRGKESFVGFHRLPLRHGMTVGELAQLFRVERDMDLELQVIACTEWRREMSWDATGLRWVNPSPNMRNLKQAYLYPGIGMLETTNLSVGRGTDTPFEIIGAPWIDGVELAAYLRQRRVPGVRWVPIRFTPDSSKYAGEECDGLYIDVVDRSLLQPVQVGVELAVALRKLYPEAWERKHLNRLIGNDEVVQLMEQGATPERILEAAAAEVDKFLSRRAAYLLYD